MKLAVVALDFDGTIAVDGALDAEVRGLVHELRERGIAVLLVTGRILADLETCVGDLRLFDAVVAENGAVLSFPATGHSRVLAAEPAPDLLAALSAAGIEQRAGQCVIEAAADAWPRVMEAIRRLELPLVVHFNRGRLMVLPQSVSKATGLREALATLRLSVHNTVAVGDAENDHELLMSVELGLAVGWGSGRLIRIADGVIDGAGPAAVARHLRRLAEDPRLPAARIGRRALLLGRGDEDQAVSLAVRGRNVLITGEPRSGKSWVAGLLAEQLILHRYAVVVIDPEGDYRTLESLPGVQVVDPSGHGPHRTDVTQALRFPDMSIVLDLSHLPAVEKADYVKAVLPVLADHRRETGVPHRIVVDEAHYFLDEPAVGELLDLAMGGYTLVTYRASQLRPEVREAVEAVIVTRISDPEEVRALAGPGIPPGDVAAWTRTLSRLALEEAVLLPGVEEAGGRLTRFRIAPRLTRHVRHRHKYLDVPIAPARAFVFTRGGVPTGLTARTLVAFARVAATLPADVLEHHLRRSDVSRWIGEVFGDTELARSVEEIENQLRMGSMLDARDAVVERIEERYARSGPKRRTLEGRMA